MSQDHGTLLGKKINVKEAQNSKHRLDLFIIFLTFCFLSVK